MPKQGNAHTVDLKDSNDQREPVTSMEASKLPQGGFCQSGGILTIGIDPGTNTGIAVWDKKCQKYLAVDTVKIHQAMDYVKNYKSTIYRVYIEQPPVNFGKSNQFRLQGAGSIKRDFSIWEDFLTECGIPFTAIRAGKNSLTKKSAKWFKQQTGWTGRTSEHSRDAALLVWQK